MRANQSTLPCPCGTTIRAARSGPNELPAFPRLEKAIARNHAARRRRDGRRERRFRVENRRAHADECGCPDHHGVVSGVGEKDESA